MNDIKRTNIKKADFISHTDRLSTALREHSSRVLMIQMDHQQAEQFKKELQSFADSIEYHYSSLILKTARNLSDVDLRLYKVAMTQANQFLFHN